MHVLARTEGLIHLCITCLSLSAAEATGERQCDPQLNMRDLTRALRKVADWETLGIWLGVDKCKIDEIAQKRSRDLHHCKTDLLAH